MTTLHNSEYSATEVQRLALQSHLDRLKTPLERNILGQFATPPVLAKEVLSYASTLTDILTPIRFLDPAIGTGCFYSALSSSSLAGRVEAAKGFEIDPEYGQPAQLLWADTSLDIEVRDFTLASPPDEQHKYNLLISNPPYVRHHHISAVSKARLGHTVRQSTGLTLSGLSGFYCYFLLLADQWMSEGGLAGWLIPSEFMDVNYGSTVRKYLTEQVELIRVHRFDPSEPQFGDAIVSSAVVWFRKRNAVPSGSVTLTYGGSLLKPLRSRMVPLCELRKSAKWSGLVDRKNVADQPATRLSDLFSIKRGLVTGNNSFFIMTKVQADLHEIPEKFLKPILPSPRYLGDDIVEADEAGLPIIATKRFLLDCDASEEEVKRDYPALAMYLATGCQKTSNTYICSRRAPWYSQEKRPAAPFLCTYMGRGLKNKAKPFRFILNRSRATAANVYLMMYPRPIVARAIAHRPELLDAIWKLLSEISSVSLLAEGRVYGGGLYKMEPKELANVPADRFIELLSSSDSRPMIQRTMFDHAI